jgi:hypothetical protein
VALPAADTQAARSASTPLVTRSELLLIGGAMAAFAGLGLLVIARGAPLGHDEAVYSLKAAELAGAGSDQAHIWQAYRAPALPALLALLWPFGVSEPAFRAVVLLFGVAGIPLTWALGRLLAGRRVGVAAAVVLAVTPQWLTASTQVLPDVPGAVIGVGAIACLAWILRRGPAAWAAAGAVLLGVVATYFRYGAPNAIGAGCVALVLLDWRRAWSLRGWVVGVGAAMLAGMAAVLLWPPLTGSAEPPLAAIRGLTGSRDMPYLTGALRDLAGLAPGIVGPLVGLLVLAAIALGAVRLARGRPAPAVVYGLTLTVVTIFLLSVGLLHFEARYAAPFLPFLAIACGLPLTEAWRFLGDRRGLVLLVAVLVIGAPFAHRDAANWHDRLRVNTNSLREASREIGRATDGECLVLSTYYPQIEWYSGCRSENIRSWEPDDLLAQIGDRTDLPVRLLAVERGKRQPDDEEIEALGDVVGEDRRDVELGSRHARIWTLRPSALEGGRD